MYTIAGPSVIIVHGVADSLCVGDGRYQNFPLSITAW